MSLIPTQKKEVAEGAVREIYDQIVRRITFIPKPMQLMSASPNLMIGYWSMMQWMLDHPRVTRRSLALVRLGVAMESDFPYCIELNSHALQVFLGVNDEQLTEIRADPSRANLPEPELALALFAIRATREPEDITSGDVQLLRDLGWDDESIFVATFHGAFMLTIGVLFATFKMNEG